ncbi:MAG TPA: cell division protein FtsH [Candidatus Peribacter riflensis]|uniref:ATP-dependent zinc metalloprotease FtsH n=1 Tax=Candidatus Peribacter riflensis TaxID=1735162 RepID=A0A0S1SM18_9BACT|nr:MAG: ATP-dependent metalloprotease FtsH [Candidatus Peribacter riflensis]ALM10562.1 MAG: ATP-dependent metalloprotease FtsH [Candidatus Peribacter riflensis]ALM11665.1 MAG: cell division protease FtsH [Candidatus Peribacter riflensis]ALM12767.1 MAG: cell division protease FtsH [Candidatus Peribacter riflensis]ALM13868.1 MAG: cell division protease FtsH [Candidatus Peribacter riflensis]
MRRPSGGRQQILGILLFVVLVGMSIYSIMAPTRGEELKEAQAREVPLSAITRGYAERDFTKIVIRDNKVYATMASGSILSSYKEASDSVSDLNWNDPKNPTVVEVENREATNIFLAILPDLLFFIFVIGGVIWLFRGIARSQSTALSFGKSRAKVADATQVKTHFADVAGCKEAKDDLVEVVDFLKNPRKYINLGAKIPKGVLLVGAPGTGKTLLARAVAGEAGVPFFSMAGSEFVEMFVGVGASRVRDLFLRAKRNAPSIIFIDEIDAVGRQRGGAGFGGGHDEREQTLNQILTEMDGFEQGTNVIVIAATNRPDVLDVALLRPGRFDRRIFIDKPDLEAREQILRVHARNKKLAKGVRLHDVAKQTVGLTGADLENIMNEAAIFAAKRQHVSLTQRDLVDATEKVTVGPEKRSRKLTPHEKEITAYHELGHAIVGHLCPESDALHKISIVSRGAALGMTWFLPQEDTYTTSRTKFLDEICGLLGGRAAEEIIFNENTTGASSDIERASQIARAMAMHYGMGDDTLGPVAYGERQGTMFLGVEPAAARNYSEEMARKIDEFVRQTIQKQYARAVEYLRQYPTQLEMLSRVLLKKETMSVDEFLDIFEGRKEVPDTPEEPEEESPVEESADDGSVQA